MSGEGKLEESADMSLLLDFYGELLKARQRELLELYFCEDLSLAEIADQTSITRQGVLDGIRRGERFLRETESKLGLVKRFRETGETAEALVRGLRAMAEGEISPDDMKTEAGRLALLAEALL